MNRIIAIDPGTTQSGWCVLDIDGKVLGSGTDDNQAVLNDLPGRFGLGEFSRDLFAIEMVASYGMAVGKETFRTVWWAGRFAEKCLRFSGQLPIEVYRQDVKLHLCNSARAKETNIRQALIDLLGPQGTKKAPGPTYGVKTHAWAALGVAVTAAAQLERRQAA